jgi:hypothetical protein
MRHSVRSTVMNTKFLELKTDEKLLNALKNAKKLSAEEVLEQRVSFVYGSMKSDSSVTREQVKKVLEESA